MKHRGLKFLSLLLTLVLLVGLLPGMSLTAYALTESKIFIGDAYTQRLGSDTKLIVTGYVMTIDGDFIDRGTVNVYLNDVQYGRYPVEFGMFSGEINVTNLSPDNYNLSVRYHDDSGTYNDNQNQYYDNPIIIAVTSVSIEPDDFQTLTVGDTTSFTATVSPSYATNKDVIWSVNGTGVTLYEDEDCTTTVILEHSTSFLTVYAKATEVGSGAVYVTSAANPNAFMNCNFEVKAAGFTVTYQPGDGASLKDGIQPPVGYTVDGQNIVKTGVTGEYQIEGLESCFNAPEGKVFDCWKDANGTEYRNGQKVDNVTANLTLKAQWKEEKKPDGGEKKTSGGGSGFDLVFNIPGADNSWEYVGGGYAPQQAYRVSLAPMQGGSAALGLTTGDSGTQMNVYPSTTVYVFPNAEQGYVLDKIVWSLIDGSASYDITEAKNFVMPAMDVVVYVTFRPVG